MKASFNKKTAAVMAVMILAVMALSYAPVMAQEPFKVKVSKDVLWVKKAEEFKMCACQAYMNAMNRLRELAKNEKPGTWCVVLDADETVISNLPFQELLLAMGEGYSGKAWTEWGLKAEAAAIPGAKEFCALVQELGGKVVIITNRKEPLRDPTLKNLNALGVKYDVLLLREGSYAKDRSKVERRTDVEKGTIKDVIEYRNIPPMKILMLVGDQAHDLYDKKDHKYEEIKDHLVKDYVIIPNPMYGSWEGGPGSEINSVGAPDTMPIVVKAGQQFNIILDANRTTGFDWTISKPLDKEVVSLAGTDYKISNPDLMGSGGKAIYTFKAMGKGKALIHMQYARSWEKKVKPAETRTYIVIVE